MADALVSPTVAVVAGAATIGLIAVASRKVKECNREGIVSLMGVMGAFVFAAQMINFTIPGTGSSGHIIGGILLSALLGPWCAFITLCSVLIVQCLIFADGGLMAIGCNILNMAAVSCLLAYPFIYKPIVRASLSTRRIMWGSILACVAGLEAGALLVTIETVASGITALPLRQFLWFMLPIHFVIGICEGVATGLVLVFVKRNSPSLLAQTDMRGLQHENGKNKTKTLAVIALGAVVMAATFAWIASSNPDGLEWSIMKITGDTELGPSAVSPVAIMPDYESHLAGIIGALIVMTMIWAISLLIFRRRKHETI